MNLSRRSLLGIGASVAAGSVVGAKLAQASEPARIAPAPVSPPVGYVMETFSHYEAGDFVVSIPTGHGSHTHNAWRYAGSMSWNEAAKPVAKTKMVVWTGSSWADLESPEGRSAIKSIRG